VLEHRANAWPLAAPGGTRYIHASPDRVARPVATRLARANGSWPAADCEFVTNKGTAHEVTRRSPDRMPTAACRSPKWWLPDDILFVSEWPHTATGKLQKMKLKQMYGDHKPSGA
jgi:acyl-CoA synthetase (AMP-forming)/AMP-acid ligase II